MNCSAIFAAVIFAVCLYSSSACALSSANIPLDSPIYLYLEKLVGYGLVTSDIKGIRPYSKSEAARMLIEAEGRLASGDYPPLAQAFCKRLRELLPREAALYERPFEAPTFDYNPLANSRLRYVYLNGVPRNFERPVHDPGNDGFFGIGNGLRPPNPYPSPVQQRGSEGTPLLENNEGVLYRSGSNLDLRLSGEAYYQSVATLLVEPMLLWSAEDDPDLRVDKAYLKLGGDGLELELGRDENWLGQGYRGALTLSNNAKNFDLIKLSSPEPIASRYLWDLKYSVIFSQFDRSVTDGQERQPLFLAAKVSFKPGNNFEIGFNLGRQVGGPGVDNSALETLRGLLGGFNNDNSNSLAGFEIRFRLPFLRNSELYWEYSGEDAASFWPIVESYLGGFYIPRLTDDGSNDLRFEYFLGNNILYTHTSFVEGYLRNGLPIGDSQGGATQDIFLRYSHWFSVRNNLALEWFHTTRGDSGRVTVNAAGQFDPNGTMQAREVKDAVRGFWTLPVYGEWNALFSYGCEWIRNFNLQSGVHQTNQLARVELSYRY